MSLSSSSQLPSGSNKRKAPAAATDPQRKKPRLLAALKTRLEALQHALDALDPLWEKYDPGFFMKSMQHKRKRMDALTLDTVEEFIASVECNQTFHVLDALDHDL